MIWDPVSYLNTRLLARESHPSQLVLHYTHVEIAFRDEIERLGGH